MIGWLERRRVRKLLAAYETRVAELEAQLEARLANRWDCDRPSDHMPYDKD